MAAADPLHPDPESPPAGPAAAADREAGPARRGPGRRPAAGIWVAVLIYVLCALTLIVVAGDAAFARQWNSFAGDVVVLVLFLLVPTGGMKRLLGLLKRWKRPGIRG